MVGEVMVGEVMVGRGEVVGSDGRGGVNEPI